MAIRFKRVQRLCDPTNKEAGKKVYPVISYQYDTSATLDEFAKEISSTSGVSEGETISVLKDFRTLLRKTLLSGRSVNIKGLGYFFLSAQSLFPCTLLSFLFILSIFHKRFSSCTSNFTSCFYKKIG